MITLQMVSTTKHQILELFRQVYIHINNNTSLHCDQGLYIALLDSFGLSILGTWLQYCMR